MPDTASPSLPPHPHSADPAAPAWADALPLAELEAAGRKVVKLGGKQIALFHTPSGLYACNNRCPHEGYPLSEGTAAAGGSVNESGNESGDESKGDAESGAGCVLTCNWHNWKFDLVSGETLVGGDTLRRYPVEVRGGMVRIDLADPPPAEQVAAALANLRDSFEDHEYDRMAREIARLEKAGGDPLEAVRAAIGWTYDRFEFGTTHAIAAAPDWLHVRDHRTGDDPALRLVPLVEIVGHLCWDSLRRDRFPFPEGRADRFDPDALEDAIEREDEPAAVAQVRAAMAGPGRRALEKPLARAAAAHYADFGHSMIYTYKTRQLLDRLGNAGEGETAEQLYLMLVRSLIYATREDLIPEFRAYRPARDRWDGTGDRVPAVEDLLGHGVERSLEAVLACSARPARLYHALMHAAGRQMLHLDAAYMTAWDRPVQDNVHFLDFSHALTFANAGRAEAERHPEIWPDVLLQIACFLGRNTKYADRSQDMSGWHVEDPAAFLTACYDRVLDHGQFEYIISAHYVKLTRALEEDLQDAPHARAEGPAWAGDAVAALNRLLNTPIKRKHTRRVAKQALGFVAAEG